jgi:hypothetical protein
MTWLKNIITKNKRSIIVGSSGLLLGGLGGFLYWKYVGCISGTCAIWSNPNSSVTYGALLGSLFLLAIVPERKK